MRLYLDHNSSAPIAPPILERFLHELAEDQGNPSSIHAHGQKSRQKVEESRRLIARFFQVHPREILFTSGGTEGAALLLQGLLTRHSTGHIVSAETEHACVYQTVTAWKQKGFEVTFLPVGSSGAVRPDDLKGVLLPHTRLITLMAANNETGVLTDLTAIAAIAHQARIPLVVDGVAWLGKAPLSLPLGVSALFFSGHKIGAPKGVGFCICRPTLKLTPLFWGGEQEYGKRAGTENVAGIVALGQAIALLEASQDSMIAHMQTLRDELEGQLRSRLPYVRLNGSGPRVSNTVNLAFMGVDGESLLMHLDQAGLSASHGSACASGALEPSRVLLKMGLPLEQVRSSIRFSIGPRTTREEIARAIALIVPTVQKLRG